MKRQLVAVLALSSGVTLAEAFEQPALDTFLAGYALCKPSQAFVAFGRSITERYANDSGTRKASVKENVRIVLPASVADAFGKPTSVNKGDHTLVSIPARGTYKGLPMRQIQFTLGNENGISADKITFDAPVAEVHKVFAADVAAAKKAAAKMEVPYTVGVQGSAKGELYCDQSN